MSTAPAQFIPIEQLASADSLARAQAFRFEDFVVSTEVRGVPLKWLALSKRLLWMAHGPDYIEPELLDWIDSLPHGATYFDLGASNGIFAIYAAAKGLEVHAFEPDPSNYFLLAYNNFLNSQASKVRLAGCYNIAASDGCGVDHMNMKAMEVGGHEKFLGKTEDVFGTPFVPGHSHPVLTISIDALCDQFCVAKPRFIKIDVDGAEEVVMRGMIKSLMGVEQVFIELTEHFLESSATPYFSHHGFTLQSKFQVQRYEGLFNCIFRKI